MKVPKDVPMSSPIVGEEDLCEMLEEKTNVEGYGIIDLSDIFKEEVQRTFNLDIESNNKIEFL